MDIIELYEIDSTNNFAKDKIKAGVNEEFIVWAHRQIAGKGRQGNIWESPEGNLYMSLVIKPNIDKKNLGQLSFAASVAIANIIESLIPTDNKVNVKWPNDVLVNNKKISGILVESDSNSEWVVIGMGVNIATAPETAISLYDLDIRISVREFMEKLIIELGLLVAKIESKGFVAIQQEWLNKAFKLNQSITARLPKETIEGIFKGIDENGVLLLELPDGTIKQILSGEVFI